MGIDPGRTVTVARGGQTRAVGDAERVRLQQGDYLSDVPRFQYGAQAVAVRLTAEAAFISFSNALIEVIWSSPPAENFR